MVRLKNSDSTNGECCLQSFDLKTDDWTLMTLSREQQCLVVKRQQFDIITTDRVLPARVVIYPVLIENVVPKYSMYVPNFNSSTEYIGKAVKKINDDYYVIELPGLLNPVKLKRNLHFVWKDPVMMELDKIKGASTGNVTTKSEYSEDRSYDKGFSNRGAKMRTKLYHPLRKDAHLPTTDDVRLPDYIREDENLCKLLDKEYSNSIFPFIDFTGLEITNDELYGTYGKILDRNPDKQFNYEEILYIMITDLWNNMTTDRLHWSVMAVFNKLGDNVIDMKGEIIRQLYKF